VFPLAVSSNGRYLQTALGVPFLVWGDTPWSLVAQLSNTEISQYLTDRQAKGFNTVLIQAPVHTYTSQTPHYNNVDGVAPFSNMSNFGVGMVEAYWTRVDHAINTAKSKGMLVIFNPAYNGSGAGDGYQAEILAQSNANLQSYGAWLANRYTQGNILWCLLGDVNPSTTLRDKHAQIWAGIRSVRTTDLMTGHTDREASPFTYLSATTGFSVDNAYTANTTVCAGVAAAYGHSPTRPTIFFEGEYEQEYDITSAGTATQTAQAMLAGSTAGQLFGNNPIWLFGSSRALFPYSGTWQSNLDSAGNTYQTNLKALFTAYEWWKLEPRTNTSLVTTSLGTGVTQITPAISSDSTFAMIGRYSSGSSTVNMAAMAPSSIRARFFNPIDGTYSTVSGSPFTNSGTQSITWPGTRILVLDASPSGGDFIPNSGFALTGTPGQGNRLVISRTSGSFGTGPTTSRIVDDYDAAVTYALDGLSDGNSIPVNLSRHPFTQNTPLEGPNLVKYSTALPRHSRQGANYRFVPRGTLEWPRVLGGQSPPDGQDILCGQMWIRRNTAGSAGGSQSNKYMRAWDSNNNDGTRISHGTENLTVVNTDGLNNTSGFERFPTVGIWDLHEVLIEPTRVRSYINGSLYGSFTGTYKDSGFPNLGMNFKLFGFDTGGNSPMSAQFQMSDIYGADSIACLFMSDSSTWSAVTNNRETQPCKGAGWGAQAIEFDHRIGQFASHSGKYLYARLASGTVEQLGRFP
jgi:hypothetical protein